jgi:hypothetical protein
MTGSVAASFETPRKRARLLRMTVEDVVGPKGLT